MMPRFGSGLLGRFGRDRRGVSAVEFALLAPVMILLYFGMTEFCQGFMAQKRLGHGASMVADLVSQTETVDTGDIDDIFGIGDLVMAPFDTTTLNQRVSSVTRDEEGDVRVDWSRAEGGDMVALVEDAVMVVPADLIAEGESLIVSEATYEYETPAKHVLKDATTFSQIYYLRPRRTETVACTDC